MKRIFIVGLCLALLNLNGASAETKGASVQKSLAGVPASELPAQAAQLVQAAKATARESVTLDVVKAAVALRPAAAPAIVGAIARAVPETAPVAAGAAAAAQPKQASEIAKAAATAAPSKAGRIVAAVCKAAPKDFRAVALAAAEAAPGSQEEVLRALATVFGDLQPSINEALHNYVANPASFPAVVALLKPAAASAPGDAVAALPSGTAGPSTARGPLIAPPYVAPSGTPANISPDTSGEIPAGGRDYAKP